MEYLLIAGIFVTIVMVYHILFNNDVEVEDDYSPGNINDGLTGEKPKDRGGEKK